MLQALLAGEVLRNQADKGRSAIFAGKALLIWDQRTSAAQRSEDRAALYRLCRLPPPYPHPADAGDHLGRLGWTCCATVGRVTGARWLRSHRAGWFTYLSREWRAVGKYPAH